MDSSLTFPNLIHPPQTSFRLSTKQNRVDIRVFSVSIVEQFQAHAFFSILSQPTAQTVHLIF